MNVNKYQEESKRTDLPDYQPVADRLSKEEVQKLLHYGMGMVTESAEFIDMLKKHLMYGRKLDDVNLREEIGDALWYISRACDVLGTSIEVECQRNIDKLKSRFPDKFTELAANERDLDKEREILENIY